MWSSTQYEYSHYRTGYHRDWINWDIHWIFISSIGEYK